MFGNIYCVQLFYVHTCFTFEIEKFYPILINSISDHMFYFLNLLLIDYVGIFSERFLSFAINSIWPVEYFFFFLDKLLGSFF